MRESEYVCNHGELFMLCAICTDVMRAMDEMMPESWEDDSYIEYMYDHYLDLDEKLLRESEDN